MDLYDYIWTYDIFIYISYTLLEQICNHNA